MGTQHFVFLLLEDHTHLTLSCAIEPLRIANVISGKSLYSWSYASIDGNSSTASNGSITLVQHRIDNIPKCDRLFVLPGNSVTKQFTPSLLSALRKARAFGVQIGALDTGAWILAEATFLNGMQASIHWEFYDGFQEKFPKVTMVSNVFVADEKHVTASGGTATADLMLHLIEQDHGHDLSVGTSEMMVYSGVRESTVDQKISLQSRRGVRNPCVLKAIEIMRNSIENPIACEDIAADVGVSLRHLQRLFTKYFNTSPSRYYVELRLERARKLILQTEMSVLEISYACGFQSAGYFARLYKKLYGTSPSIQRS